MSKVIVAGSINMDLVATADRFPRPGETVPGRSFNTFPGGKGANQAVAAARLGAAVEMVGKIGGDSFGAELRAFLQRDGVGLEHTTLERSVATGTALIVVSEAGENTIVVVPGANGRVNPADVDRLIVEKGDVLVSQFEIPLSAIKRLFERGRSVGATNILNPAPAVECDHSLLSLVDVLVLNETELAFYLGEDVDLTLHESVASAARRVRSHREQVVVVTLGERGCTAIVGDRRIDVEGRRVKVVDTTAAGDCFVGALAARIADGVSIDQAVRYANTAASICVQRAGAGPSLPTAGDVDATHGEGATSNAA